MINVLFRGRHIPTLLNLCSCNFPFPDCAGGPEETDMDIGRQLLAKMRRKRKNDHTGPTSPKGLEIHFYTQVTPPLIKTTGCHTGEDLCIECAKLFGKLSCQMDWEAYLTLVLKFL